MANWLIFLSIYDIVGIILRSLQNITFSQKPYEIGAIISSLMDEKVEIERIN